MYCTRFPSWLRRGRLRRRPADGARSGVPRLRRETAPREVRTPTARQYGLARAVAAAPVSHCRKRQRGSAAENRHGGAPRGVPVAPGQVRASQARASRLARATRRKKECACRRSTPPPRGWLNKVRDGGRRRAPRETSVAVRRELRRGCSKKQTELNNCLIPRTARLRDLQQACRGGPIASCDLRNFRDPATNCCLCRGARAEIAGL